MINLVTKWVNFKRRLQTLKSLKDKPGALEAIESMRSQLGSIPFTELVVNDAKLLDIYFDEIKAFERDILTTL